MDSLVLRLESTQSVIRLRHPHPTPVCQGLLASGSGGEHRPISTAGVGFRNRHTFLFASPDFYTRSSTLITRTTPISIHTPISLTQSVCLTGLSTLSIVHHTLSVRVKEGGEVALAPDRSARPWAAPRRRTGWGATWMRPAPWGPFAPTGGGIIAHRRIVTNGPSLCSEGPHPPRRSGRLTPSRRSWAQGPRRPLPPIEAPVNSPRAPVALYPSTTTHPCPRPHASLPRGERGHDQLPHDDTRISPLPNGNR